MKKKENRGGKRPNSGRKKGFKMPKEKLKEPTVVMRIPLSKVEQVKKILGVKKKPG
jgi:hypothetical protein